MPKRSPIMRSALELFEHCLEHYAAGGERDRKIVALNLAQVVELSLKASLVVHNESIYEKDGKRTLNAYSCMDTLEKKWAVNPLPFRSRVEILIDERNAIQHRYGTLDIITADYHMESAVGILAEILKRDFDTDLHALVRENFPKEVWSKCRFIELEEEQRPADAIPSADENPTLSFIQGFAAFEKGIYGRVMALEGGIDPVQSTLDVVMKFLANVPGVEPDLIAQAPRVFKLRNSVVHGRGEASADDVGLALNKMDKILELMDHPKNLEVLKRAAEASRQGIKGTRLDKGAENG